MTRILHLDTATRVCSVCLSTDGRPSPPAESHEEKSHATRLTIMIEQVLEAAGMKVSDLDAISLAIGPGSYTGLRIGTSVVKGMAYGASLPVIGISTLQSLTAVAIRKMHDGEGHSPSDGSYWYCPMVDARRMEVYRAFYNKSLEEVVPVGADILEKESYRAILDERNVIFFGNGSNKASEIISHPNASFIHGVEASATGQATLALEKFKRNEFLNVAYFEPSYLKEFIATLPKNRIF